MATDVNEITDFQGNRTIQADIAEERSRVERFVARAGGRVRAARQRKGMSRRVLSELSGVSQRYLAQLESGAGNISIALLFRVANALDHRIEWFVGDDDPWESEPLQVAELFRSANTDTRNQVLELLGPKQTEQFKGQRICLIGLRGAGKSTLGRSLSEHLAMPFHELNQEIEEQSGMPVEEVMALYGPEGYRRLERQALERLVAATETLILAAAGGIVAEPGTYKFLLRHFHTIWLKASPEEHMARVRAQGDHRPMAGNPKAMDDLKSLLTSREALYARADRVVDTTGKPPPVSTAELLKVAADLGFDER